MEYGILCVLPPIVAIVLALITKEVITSLLLGIITGGLIFSGGNIIVAFEEVFTIMGNKVGDNGQMIIFLALLGSLVMVINMAGGSFAYGKWAGTKIKSKTSAKLASAILGMLIFIDDYFNCLTVGAVMKPITDKNEVSRAKLANIIDSTAAPICILAPVSSWAASIVAIIGDTGVKNPMNVFLSTIPINLYAMLTIFSVIYFAFSKTEIGLMEKFERDDTSALSEKGELGYEYSKKGKVVDLLIPIISLISITVLMMLRTGGFFDGQSAASAFGNSNVNLSLVIASVLSLMVCFLMYIPRKLLTFKNFMNSIVEGMKSMILPISILILAWTIGGITSSDFLDTGGFIAHQINNTQMPMGVLPVIIFLVAAFLSFSTGTAWGTFGILIPILVPILMKTNHMEYLSIILASIFSGSVFGDHCSPISDTSILSSAGSDCDHISHVSSQLPYAFICGASAAIGFLVSGLTGRDIYALPVGLISLIVFFEIAKKITIKKLGKKTV